MATDPSLRWQDVRSSVASWVRAAVTESAAFASLRSAGEMGELALKSVKVVVTRPANWVEDAVNEMAIACRRCLIPLVVSHAFYCLSFGMLLFGVIVSDLGVADRLTGAVFIGWAREVATWITAMVFAGVAGSAITADLGARKIRDELDALEVMGVEKIRKLVTPRVVAMTLTCPVLAVLSLLVVSITMVSFAPGILGVTRAVALHNIETNIIPSDLYSMILKNLIIGFFVGVVACHKGLNCSGGAEGVGRAVNQTVVISFFGIWMFNSFFVLAYLTLFPQLAVFRG